LSAGEAARARAPRGGAPRSSAGFSYIGLLIAVAILGIALSAVGTVWRTAAQRDHEQELLDFGHEFEAAIDSYYRTGGQYPQTVDDLIEDKRWPEPHHHLRRLRVDPMTGTADWTILRIDGLGITGIASTSDVEPIKKSGFAPDEETFRDAKTYSDWQFVYSPRTLRHRAASIPAAAD
jgi:type II secretory pathway pseudopilin PulG